MSPQTVPEENLSPVWSGDTRAPLPLLGDEKTLLTSYLEYYRQTVELKCQGVPKERLNDRTMPPSTMTLHGLVRHLAAVERWWFHYQYAGEKVELLYYSNDDPNQDFDDLSGDFDDALATWRAQCEHSREIVARSALDDTGTRDRDGEPFSLRRALLHMIVEYARHSGHADLLREGIDGAVGT